MPDPYGAPGCLPGPRPAFVGSGMPDPYREFWAGVPGQRPASLAQVLPLRVKEIEPEGACQMPRFQPRQVYSLETAAGVDVFCERKTGGR